MLFTGINVIEPLLPPATVDAIKAAQRCAKNSTVVAKFTGIVSTKSASAVGVAYAVLGPINNSKCARDVRRSYGFRLEIVVLSFSLSILMSTIRSTFGELNVDDIANDDVKRKLRNAVATINGSSDAYRDYQQFVIRGTVLRKVRFCFDSIWRKILFTVAFFCFADRRQRYGNGGRVRGGARCCR